MTEPTLHERARKRVAEYDAAPAWRRVEQSDSALIYDLDAALAASEEAHAETKRERDALRKHLTAIGAGTAETESAQ